MRTCFDEFVSVRLPRASAAHAGTELTGKRPGATATCGADMTRSLKSPLVDAPHSDKQSRAGGTTVDELAILGD